MHRRARCSRRFRFARSACARGIDADTAAAVLAVVLLPVHWPVVLAVGLVSTALMGLVICLVHRLVWTPTRTAAPVLFAYLHKAAISPLANVLIGIVTLSFCCEDSLRLLRILLVLVAFVRACWYVRYLLRGRSARHEHSVATRHRACVRHNRRWPRFAVLEVFASSTSHQPAGELCTRTRLASWRLFSGPGFVKRIIARKLGMFAITR